MARKYNYSNELIAELNNVSKNPCGATVCENADNCKEKGPTDTQGRPLCLQCKEGKCVDFKLLRKFLDVEKSQDEATTQAAKVGGVGGAAAVALFGMKAGQGVGGEQTAKAADTEALTALKTLYGDFIEAVVNNLRKDGLKVVKVESLNDTSVELYINDAIKVHIPGYQGKETPYSAQLPLFKSWWPQAKTLGETCTPFTIGYKTGGTREKKVSVAWHGTDPSLSNVHPIPPKRYFGWLQAAKPGEQALVRPVNKSEERLASAVAIAWAGAWQVWNDTLKQQVQKCREFEGKVVAPAPVVVAAPPPQAAATVSAQAAVNATAKETKNALALAPPPPPALAVASVVAPSATPAVETKSVLTKAELRAMYGIKKKKKKKKQSNQGGGRRTRRRRHKKHTRRRKHKKRTKRRHKRRRRRRTRKR